MGHPLHGDPGRALGPRLAPRLPVLSGVAEGIVAFLLSALLARVFPVFAVPLAIFILQYGVIWFATFLASQSLLRIVFPNWRYRGGQWLF